MKFKLYFIVFSIMIVACASKKTTVPSTTLNQTNPKFIFLNYHIYKDTKNKKQVEFINKIVADGKLKHKGNKYIKTGKIGDIKCIQLDKNAQEITSIYIQNPLHKNIEHLGDSLTFENRTLDFNRSTLSLRLQLYEQTNFILLQEVIDSVENTRPLIKTKLN